MLSIEDYADFNWSFHDKFLLETERGNYIWSDPDYGGDNTIRPFDGNLKEFCRQENIPYVRNKGRHLIKSYCGPEVNIRE